MNMAKSFLSISVMGLVAGGLALSVAPQAVAQAPARSDSQIQADVMSKLKADPQLESVTVGAGVQGGVVTLTGNVASEDQLTQAENDISSIEGITKIVDNMQVNPTVPTASAPAGVQNEAAQAAQNAPPPPDNGDAQAQNPAPGQAQGQDQQQQFPQGPPPEHGTYQGQPPPMPDDAQNGQGPAGQGPGGQGQYGQGPAGPGQYPQGQYPQGPGYGPGQGPYGQGQYRPRVAHYDPGNRSVTLPVGTVLTVRTLQPLVAGQDKPGEFFKGVVGIDVMGDRGIAIPRGTPISGQVVDSKKAGHYKGGAVLTLQLSNLTLGNQSYNLASDVWNFTTAGKGGYTAGNTVGGAAFGALLGAIAGGGPGAAIGAAAGGVTGAATSGVGRTPQAYVPAEGLVTFRLTQPITITTVTPDQARLLANAAPPMPQQPMRRPPPPPGYYYGPYGPYYYRY
jgi:hypothetical protein